MLMVVALALGNGPAAAGDDGAGPMRGSRIAKLGLALEAPPASLVEARLAVEAARRERVVRALAAVELDDAEIALVWTERAAAEGAGAVEIGHLAHLTRQRAGLARARAAERRAEQELRALRRARWRTGALPEASR